MDSKILVVCPNDALKESFVPRLEHVCKYSCIKEYSTIEDLKTRSEPTPTNNIFTSLINFFTSLFAQKKPEGIGLTLYHTVHSFDQASEISDDLNDIDLFILLLDETTLDNAEAIKTYLTTANRQSPNAKFQIVFYKDFNNKDSYSKKEEYEAKIKNQINTFFSPQFEKLKWTPQKNPLVRDFIYFGDGNGANHIFNTLMEPHWEKLQSILEALKKEEIGYRIRQFFITLWQGIISEKAASSWRNSTPEKEEKISEIDESDDSLLSTNLKTDSENSRVIEEKKNDFQESETIFSSPLTNIEPQATKLTPDEVLNELSSVGKNTSLTLTQKQERAVSLVRDNIEQFNSQEDIFKFIPLIASKEFENGEPTYEFREASYSQVCDIPNQIFICKDVNEGEIHYKVFNRKGGAGILEKLNPDALKAYSTDDLKAAIINDAKQKRYLLSSEICTPYLFIREREKGFLCDLFGRYTNTKAWGTITELLEQRLDTLLKDNPYSSLPSIKEAMFRK